MFQVFLIIFWATIRLQSRGEAVYDPSVGAADSSPQGEGSSGCIRGAVRAERMNPFPTKFVAAAAAIESHFIRRKRHLPLKGKATAAAAAIELHLIRRKRHLPLKGKAMTYLRHVSGAKRTSMGKISRRPRNMSKHRTALLIILSPETPMVKVFESMP